MATRLQVRLSGRDGRFGLRRLSTPPWLELWIADLEQSSGDAPDSLNAAERARAERFVFEQDRWRYRAAHRVLRRLLSLRTGIPDAALRIEAGPYGKPYLAGRPSCAFNLSHSGNIALVALADDGQIGVDVEVLRETPDLDDLVRLHFTADERRAIDAVSAESRDKAFLLGWTRKEACLKAIGLGLNIAPESVDAGVIPVDRAVPIDTPQGMATVVVQSFICDDVICAVARKTFW